MMNTIAVKHNIEVAHRLFELPGKCEQIHGHSMWVTMELTGELNSKGILAGIEYGDLKKVFRGFLDQTYDHRLLLNQRDPYAQPLSYDEGKTSQFLPGLLTVKDDPTTENIAKWVAEEMAKFKLGEFSNPEDLWEVKVTVWETSVNMASHTIERHPL